MIRFYLIRHGETDWNAAKRLQGMTDIPLNKNGEALAYRTGEAMKDIPLDLIYTSPLRRAVRTAELVRAERRIPIIADERLREISFGKYEGLVHKGEHFNIPDADFADFFRAPAAYRTPPEGESLQELLCRTGDFLEEMKRREDLQGKTVLLSAHGAAVCALLANMKGSPLNGFWGEGVHKNCGVSCAELRDGAYSILWENRIFYEEA